MGAKVIVAETGKFFYVRDDSKDYHCQYGMIKSSELKKSIGEIVSNTGKKFRIFKPGFIDTYRKIKRSAQIIPLKDVALIVAETGIDKSSVVVDAGAGSGALCCFLAHIAKEVITYDIREDFIKVVEKNKELLGLKNLKIKNKNIYDGIDEKNVDVVTLDLPEPWLAIESVKKALKAGGFLVSYSPTVPQVADFVNKIIGADDDNVNTGNISDFVHLKTVELMEREWEVKGRKVRPLSQQIGHSGFLTFVRKL